MTDKHRVWLVLPREGKSPRPVEYNDWQDFRLVGEYDSYDAALEAYHPLDRALVQRRLYMADPDDKGWDWRIDVEPVPWPGAYLAVRSADDPAWKPGRHFGWGSRKATTGPVRLLVGSTVSRGTKDDREQVKKWAEPRGYYSTEGGWIYRKMGERRSSKDPSVVQGWHSFALTYMPRPSVLTWGEWHDRRYRLIEAQTAMPLR